MDAGAAGVGELVELVKQGGAVVLAVGVWYELRGFRKELRDGFASLLSTVLASQPPARRRRRRPTVAAGPQPPRASG